MIITRAPLRISFAGGGTDLRAFYEKEKGSVVSTAIDKYIYIAVHKYFDDKILLKYSQTELVDDVNNIKNERFRECLKFLGITKGIEITSIADIPSKTGVGSSSSFTVALLNALHAYKSEHVSLEQLAEEACHVEINLLREPIGKQDQYIAAHGGLKFIEFYSDERVVVTPLIIKRETLEILNDNLLMFYTGIQRSASEVLKEQKEKTDEKRNNLSKMKQISEEIRDSLIKGDLDGFAEGLHRGWMEKRQVTGKISNTLIDNYYDTAIRSGAKGGKLLGAGGGGFLLFYCEKDRQNNLRNALEELKELKFNLEPEGCRPIYIGERWAV
jgi:D-glycero-alpha-D-manno-heptose-7-phosphate kinase